MLPEKSPDAIATGLKFRELPVEAWNDRLRPESCRWLVVTQSGFGEAWWMPRQAASSILPMAGMTGIEVVAYSAAKAQSLT